MHKTLNNSIFFLLYGGHIIRIKTTSIEWITKSMYENDQNNGHRSNPIGIIDSLLYIVCFARIGYSICILVQSLNISVTTFILWNVFRVFTKWHLMIIIVIFVHICFYYFSQVFVLRLKLIIILIWLILFFVIFILLLIYNHYINSLCRMLRFLIWNFTWWLGPCIFLNYKVLRKVWQALPHIF